MVEQKTTRYFDFIVMKNSSSVSFGMKLPVSLGTVDIGKHNFGELTASKNIPNLGMGTT